MATQKQKNHLIGVKEKGLAAVDTLQTTLDDLRFTLTDFGNKVDAIVVGDVKPPEAVATVKKLGINGHPEMQKAYIDMPLDTQYGLIKGIFDALRFDRKKTHPVSGLHDLYTTMKGIELCPMLYPSGIDFNSTNLSLQEDNGYKLALDFCTKNAPYFKIVELGNEIDNKCILSAKEVGDKVDHYDRTKLKAAAAYLKGMARAVKDVGLHRCSIDATWLHFGFMDFMNDSGMEYDVQDWHWYDDQERIRIDKDPIENIVSERYKKPVRFTEVGKRFVPRYSQAEQAQQDIYFIALVKRLNAHPNVEKVFIHELLKQPTLGSDWEREYGIYVNAEKPTPIVELLRGIN